MDYKTQASAISVYAAQKYGDTWEIAVNAAKNGNLGVAFRTKAATGITSDDSGYVYEVSGTGKSSNARYMLNGRSEEHTSELQSRFDLVCRLLLEKKKKRHRGKRHE